jgi:hypothetical protein
VQQEGRVALQELHDRVEGTVLRRYLLVFSLSF